MNEHRFTTFQVSKGLGIKYGRLREWIDRGYVEPSIQKAAGAGTRSIFSLFDVYLVKLFDFLIDRGFSREDAATRIKALAEDFRGEFTLAPHDTQEFRVNFIALGREKDSIMVIHRWTLGEKGSAVKDIEEPLSSLLTEESDDQYIVNFKKIRDDVDRIFL